MQICKNNGTLPFPGLARCGFIGTSLLNSLTDNNILTKTDVSNLYQNIGTISKNIKNDSQKIWVNKIYRRSF